MIGIGSSEDTLLIVWSPTLSLAILEAELSVWMHQAKASLSLGLGEVLHEVEHFWQ